MSLGAVIDDIYILTNDNSILYLWSPAVKF